MAVSASFHRNVLLLTQVILPTDDFKKHFREGMFDKPNTAGFLHVSQYLLMIHNSERFKKLIEWPVTCKKSEAKYRNNVKDYLIVIAAENPDIGFPNILASHLLHAGGSKFTIIMWKLSQVVVRTYITRETTCNVISAPQAGATRNLSKKFLQETNTRINYNILNCHTDLSAIEEAAKTALEKEKGILAKIRAEIFEKERSIVDLTSIAPVHPSVKKQLADSNDEEVIQMWKRNIHKGINHIQKQNVILKDMVELSKRVNDVIVNNSSDAKVVDAKQLKRINSATVSELVPPSIQCLLFHLYKNDELVLNNFLLFFNALLTELHQKLKSKPLKDFSECLSQIEASYTDIKSAMNYFQTFFMDIIRVSLEVQSVFHQKNGIQVYSDDLLPIMNNVLLMQSPVIRIDTNCSDEKNELQKRLQFTPVQASYKSLFSRYERQNQNTLHGSKQRGNLLVSRINFDDTISMSNNEKPVHPCFITPKKNSSSIKQSGKYSRLFSTRAKRNNRAANLSIMSLPCCSKANSTAITNAIGEMHDISELSLNITGAEFATPEKLPLKQQNKSDNASEIDDVVNALPIKPSIPEISATTEVEITSNCDKSIVKIEQATHKRRSIGDLVERYKRLLELSNRTPSPKISYVEHENE